MAEKVAAAGVDGLICLNDAMGGQTGNRSAQTFAEELRGIDLPLIKPGPSPTELTYDERLSWATPGRASARAS